MIHYATEEKLAVRTIASLHKFVKHNTSRYIKIHLHNLRNQSVQPVVLHVSHFTEPP